MKLFNFVRRALVAGTTLAVVGSASPADAQTGNRVDPRQYETMRALGHYVDIGAQFTLDEAESFSADQNPRERSLIVSLEDFTRRTTAFHDRLDNYEVSPFDFGSEASRLRRLALRVNRNLRGVNVARDVYDDWTAVIDGLNRIVRVARGQSVSVPQAPAEWESAGGDDYQGNADDHNSTDPNHHQGETYGNRGSAGYPGNRSGDGYRNGNLSVPDLQQFRRLAHQLDVQVSEAHNLADREGANDRARVDMLEEFRQFNQRTSALHDRTDADALDPQQIGPVVDQLFRDAQAVDRRMRDARLFQGEWDKWQQAMRTLQQMGEMLR
ncbi:MAG: hypothetical protein ABIR28_09455, partial [Vicinamibacteria bacterium]